MISSSHHTAVYAVLPPRQVIVDAPRTAPSIPFFHYASVQKSLERLLYIWGIRCVFVLLLSASTRFTKHPCRCCGVFKRA